MNLRTTHGWFFFLMLALSGATAAAVLPGPFPTKLAGTVSSFNNEKPAFGTAVALSADGRTALVGAPKFSSNMGRAWIFNYDGLSWQSGPGLAPDACSLNSHMGTSVALSADGATAIVGGYLDDCAAGFQAGRIFTFTRDGSGVWTGQGALRGNDANGIAMQGRAVAVSADGNTAIAGGPGDVAGPISSAGAAWVFTRSGGTWSQQGAKLVGTDFAGGAQQGISVGLSSDGNTAIVGGSSDNGFTGAAWIYVRTNGAWSQQGPKLVGNDVVGAQAQQGQAVALSADGNTAIVGSPAENDSVGAVRIYTRNGGVWSQQGPRLVGTDYVLTPLQGSSVALSADGNLALVGGPLDNVNIGAAWIFARSGGIWSQQGPKRVGNMPLVAPHQGSAVALSADGGTALVGAARDNNDQGAAWAYTGQPCTLDVDGNQTIDALTDGLILLRAMFGLTGTTVTNGAVGAGATRTGWSALRGYLNTNCGAAFAQ